MRATTATVPTLMVLPVLVGAGRLARTEVNGG
jgi:hypothetical protein